MTRLISQYEVDFGPCEEDEAERMRTVHGWQRACTLVHVFERTSPRPYRAFWFRVQFLLSSMSDGLLPVMIKKEREAPMPPPVTARYVDVNGVKISRAEFLRWFKSMKAARA